MTAVDAADAKTQLSDLLRRAAAGEEIVITDPGGPAAQLVHVETPPEVDEPKPPRQGGQLAGQIWIADDFDAPLPKEIEDLFYYGERGHQEGGQHGHG